MTSMSTFVVTDCFAEQYFLALLTEAADASACAWQDHVRWEAQDG